MVDGDFNLAFSETWGSPYDPQAFASSWGTPDEAYHVALDGLKEPYTKDVLLGKISDVLTMESEAEREEAWTEILASASRPQSPGASPGTPPATSSSTTQVSWIAASLVLPPSSPLTRALLLQCTPSEF